MKHLLKTAAIAVIAGAFALGSAASAQSWQGHNDRGGHHQGRDNGHRGGDRDNHRDNDRHGGGWGGNGGYEHRRYDRDDNRGYNRGYGYQQSYRHSGWHDRSDWRRGGHVARYDWDRGYRVDYRGHRRLYSPPYGYEWRQVDDNYVLAAIASGLIASIIINDGY